MYIYIYTNQLPRGLGSFLLEKGCTIAWLALFFSFSPRPCRPTGAAKMTTKITGPTMMEVNFCITKKESGPIMASDDQ